MEPLQGVFGPSWPILESSPRFWGHFGASTGVFGAILAHLRGFWGQYWASAGGFGAILGRVWSYFGASAGGFGAILAYFRAYFRCLGQFPRVWGLFWLVLEPLGGIGAICEGLGPFWPILGGFGAILEGLGPIYVRSNLRPWLILRAFWGAFGEFQRVLVGFGPILAYLRGFA